MGQEPIAKWPEGCCALLVPDPFFKARYLKHELRKLPMSVTTKTRESIDSIVALREVSWETYERLRSADGNRGVRMTYDHGVLILMTPSRRHERIAEILGRLVFAWTEEKQIACLSGGSTTMKSRLLDRSLEPDKCFYIQNETAARDRDEYDADIDPPPDLVIEVDVTSLSTTRMPLYAEFHVPEIWRWIEDRIEIYRLIDGAWASSKQSVSLPEFPFEQTLKILELRYEVDETSLVRKFREAISA